MFQQINYNSSVMDYSANSASSSIYDHTGGVDIPKSSPMFFNGNVDQSQSMGFENQFISQSTYYVPKPPPPNSSTNYQVPQFSTSMDVPGNGTSTNAANRFATTGNKRKLEMNITTSTNNNFNPIIQNQPQYIYNNFQPTNKTATTSIDDINMKILNNQLTPTSVCTQNSNNNNNSTVNNNNIDKKDIIQQQPNNLNISSPNISVYFHQGVVQSNSQNSDIMQPNSANSSPNSFPFTNALPNDFNAKVEFSPISISPTPMSSDDNTSATTIAPKPSKPSAKSKKSKSSASSTSQAPITSSPQSVSTPTPATVPSESSENLAILEPPQTNKKSKKSKTSSALTPANTSNTTTAITATVTPAPATGTVSSRGGKSKSRSKSNNSKSSSISLLPKTSPTTITTTTPATSTVATSNFESFSLETTAPTEQHITQPIQEFPHPPIQMPFDNCVNSACNRFNFIIAELSPLQTVRFLNYVHTTLLAQYPNHTPASMRGFEDPIVTGNIANYETNSIVSLRQQQLSHPITTIPMQTTIIQVPTVQTQNIPPTPTQTPTFETQTKPIQIKVEVKPEPNNIEKKKIESSQTTTSSKPKLPSKRVAESQSFHSGTSRIKTKPKKKKHVKKSKAPNTIANDFVTNRRSPLASVDIHNVLTESVLSTFNSEELSNLSTLLAPGDKIEDLFKNKYFINSLEIYKRNLELGTYEEYEIPKMVKNNQMVDEDTVMSNDEKSSVTSTPSPITSISTTNSDPPPESTASIAQTTSSPTQNSTPTPMNTN